MKNYSIQPGDKIKRKKAPAIYHEGIVFYDGLVFHNTPEKGEHVSSISEFSQGERIKVIPQSYSVRLKNLDNVREILDNPHPYKFLRNNCEHSVNKVISGISRSPTLAAVATLAIIGFFIYFARQRGQAVIGGDVPNIVETQSGFHLFK